MKHRIHRDNLMFHWFTKHHEIVMGFRHAHRGTCSTCGKAIPEGNTVCDRCFGRDKEVSGK